MQKGVIQMPDNGGRRHAIEMHFQEAVKLSEQIAEMATALKSIGEQMLPNVIGKTKRVWKGKSADILTGKEAMYIATITTEAQKLNILAIDLKKKAERIYQAELKNLLLAEMRYYK